ncbi:hypothetical protein, partial [Salmonella enterica]|uniref:hypothetical protein n=1 Tax=Salmonella enterica TaxID=28901 RepID=UPI001A7EB8E9
PTVNLGMALGLPAVTATWTQSAAAKNQGNPGSAMLLGTLKLIRHAMAEAFHIIPRAGACGPLSPLVSVLTGQGLVVCRRFTLGV